MYGYIYITTNLINGKQYIGQHKSENFDSKYKGSGTYLRNAFGTYGFENFKVELLEECFSKEELNDREIYWIDHYDAVNSKNFYNQIPGGQNWTPQHGMKHKHLHGRIPTISESKRGKKWYNNGQMNLFIYPEDATDDLVEGMLPKRHRSEEANLKHSEKLRGKICVNKDGISKMISPDKLNEYLLQGYSKGSCNYKGSGMIGKSQSDYHNQKVSERTRGTVWIHNLTCNKRVKSEELDSFLSKGYVLGRLKI